MTSFKKLSEEQRRQYAEAIDIIENLIAQLSESDVAQGTLGDAEALIRQEGMNLTRKLKEGYLNQQNDRE